VGVDCCLTTHLVQQFYESSQTGAIEVVNVLFQVLVTEKFAEEWSVLVVGWAEPLKPCLDIRNRCRIRGDRHYRLTWACPFVEVHSGKDRSGRW